MTADPILAHLEAVVALGERMAHDARELIAARKQATAGLVQLSVDIDDERHQFSQVDVPGLHLSPMCQCGEGPDHPTHATPDPTPPLPGAVRVDDTERDGEMVPTWEVQGGEALKVLVGWPGTGKWECNGYRRCDALGDDNWSGWSGSDADCTYLVRRKAEVQ